MSVRLIPSLMAAVLAGASGATAAFDTSFPAMATGENGWTVDPLLTVGETISATAGGMNPSTAGDYTPVGVLDGLGAYRHSDDIVRVFANHELLQHRGNAYWVNAGTPSAFQMTGARISYFDVRISSRTIVDAGIAYNRIYDANGEVPSDTGFLANDFGGFSRFCSSALFEAGLFNTGASRDRGRAKGLADTIYFSGEEDGGSFNGVGGAEWALDVANGDLWHVPAMGRGAWENLTQVDTGDAATVAFILADDTSPFDADGDGEDEAAPLFLYVGKKKPKGDFRERNGLSEGRLFVWVADSGETKPSQFHTEGTLQGRWIPVDNQATGVPSEDGATGYDEYGYPTQRNLWRQAEALGAFGFSRPEDVAYNPADPSEIVLASTGVDTYDVLPSGDGADSFGTLYTLKTNFANLTAELTIVYDGDADPSRALRSPDNLDWADDGYIYVQEDKAEEDTLSGEPLFGPGAANPNEASILKLDPATGLISRVARIDRSVVLDPTTVDPYSAVDNDAGVTGAWETSGILDVSTLFDEPAGTLFLFDVQAHGIEDQDVVAGNADSRILDDDLVEGGQLGFLLRD